MGITIQSVYDEVPFYNSRRTPPGATTAQIINGLKGNGAGYKDYPLIREYLKVLYSREYIEREWHGENLD